MIYLTDGNTPLNEAFNDEIVQERNNAYQLTFRFPTSDPKWELLKEETFLTADDLHGEQDFYIFEVEKKHGYIQVYANQVFTLLNNYVVNSISLDRVTGSTALSRFAGSITRDNPFSFFSDIEDRHTFNVEYKNAMEAFAKDKHSIIGQWGGDLVRHGYQVRLLKNGGSENESLFMYKKNLSSYQHKTSTKSLKTRITFKTTVKGEGEKAPDVDYVVVIDSPLLGKYNQIYEAVVEVNDQNVTDRSSLIEYGKQYFRISMCDMLEDNLEISVVGQSDVAVRMFDVVSIYHEEYDFDVRKKITKYTYSPMAKRLKSIGFGTFQSSLANAIGGIVNDAVLNETRNLNQIFDERLKKEIANADRAFNAEFAKREQAITDAIEEYKAKAEELGSKIHEEIEKERPEFVKRIREELVSGADSIAELSKKLARVSETARINADLIGGDGTTKYNKNRLNGRTAVKLAYGTDYVVGHNGEGFEVGKQYVISWSATCTSHEKKDVMDITIQDVRSPALEHNGRFYKVFQPQSHDELIILHHMSCAGDTVLTDIQIEQGNFPTSFVEPAVTQRTLSGLFKDMRSIELELRDPNSTLWGKIQQNNQGALTQFFDKNVKSAIAQTAKEIRQEVRDASNSARVQVTSEGVTIGTTTLTGEQLASTISASPRGVDIIAPKIKVKSNMIVDGSITSSKIAAGSVTANALDAGSVTADKVKFDTAFIQRLVSQQAFVDELFAKKATITKIQNVDFTGNNIKGGRISSLNGNTTFDLQTGWIDMNSHGVGIRNRFPNRPLQYLVFGSGNINGVDGSYTALMSNRNQNVGIDHTSAGIQIWNGRDGSNVQTAINLYGHKITFRLSAQEKLRETVIDTYTGKMYGIEDIILGESSLRKVLDNIFDNFNNLAAVAGNYSRGYYGKWR
jgi:phage minor structural protein